ncbi:hypothetical protein RCL_jg16287.t1 [Rhizophagus clarus]|uniref:Uncharacterized protein n=1 Tax=Rhizophagus clarus TaxID=94130 RepID=A0A8H3M7R2_9GLOM|nr:hypothetical protein RCL_jg16287.t1 [Rhizophagus clarus]
MIYFSYIMHPRLIAYYRRNNRNHSSTGVVFAGHPLLRSGLAINIVSTYLSRIKRIRLASNIELISLGELRFANNP